MRALAAAARSSSRDRSPAATSRASRSVVARRSASASRRRAVSASASRAAAARRSAAASSPRAWRSARSAAQLRQRLGERPFRVRERRVELGIAARHGSREEPALQLEVALGRRPLVGEARSVASDRLDLAARRAARTCSADSAGAGAVVGLASLSLGPGPRSELRRQPAGCLLGRPQRRQRLVGVARSALSRTARVRGPARGLVPAGVSREEQRGRELLAGGQPRRLLLGLGRQPPGLRPELGEDVLDPGEVRLGLGELLLGLAPAPLVAADAGDLLEQRPPLLGPERERLVDHALADEQERVVGEVGRVEQVDEVAQPDRAAC